MSVVSHPSDISTLNSALCDTTNIPLLNKKIDIIDQTLLSSNLIMESMRDYLLNEDNFTTAYKKPLQAQCPEILIEIGNIPIPALLDTGSKITCVSSEIYEQNVHSWKDLPTFPLTGIKAIEFTGKKSVNLKKQFRAEVGLKHLVIDFNFLVVPKLVRPCIMGIDFQEHMGAVIDLRSESVFFVHPDSSDTVECTFHLRECELNDRHEVNSAFAEFSTHLGHEIDHQFASTPQLIEDSDILTDTEIKEKLCLINEISDLERDNLSNLIKKYRSIFNKVPGRFLSYVYRFDIKDESPFASRPHPVAFKNRDTVGAALKQMEAQGII